MERGFFNVFFFFSYKDTIPYKGHQYYRDTSPYKDTISSQAFSDQATTQYAIPTRILVSYLHGIDRVVGMMENKNINTKFAHFNKYY
jgi:hypothetical protein